MHLVSNSIVSKELLHMLEKLSRLAIDKLFVGK